MKEGVYINIKLPDVNIISGIFGETSTLKVEFEREGCEIHLTGDIQ